MGRARHRVILLTDDERRRIRAASLRAQRKRRRIAHWFSSAGRWRLSALAGFPFAALFATRRISGVIQVVSPSWGRWSAPASEEPSLRCRIGNDKLRARRCRPWVECAPRAAWSFFRAFHTLWGHRSDAMRFDPVRPRPASSRTECWERSMFRAGRWMSRDASELALPSWGTRSRRKSRSLQEVDERAGIRHVVLSCSSQQQQKSAAAGGRYGKCRDVALGLLRERM